MNRTKADLAAVARKPGLGWEWFGKRWPYRCDRCGSRDVGMQLLPDVRPKSSPDRQADLAAAQALVAEIENAERGRAERGRAWTAFPFRLHPVTGGPKRASWRSRRPALTGIYVEQKLAGRARLCSARRDEAS
jgi:hypothetical protein